MSDQFRVNGFAHSWGSIVLKIDGDRYTGFDLIEYGDKLEETQSAGMGKSHAPRRRSRGKYTTEPGKLRGWKSNVHELRQALALKAQDGRSYGMVTFEAVVQFIEFESGLDMTVSLKECRLLEDKGSHEESNTEPLKEEIGISYTAVVRNGLTLFDSSDGLP